MGRILGFDNKGEWISDEVLYQVADEYPMTEELEDHQYIKSYIIAQTEIASFMDKNGDVKHIT